MIRISIKLILSVFLILFLSSCGVGPQKHYSNFIEESLVDIDYNPVLLINVRIKNTINSKHFLKVKMIEFEKDGKKIVYRCLPQNMRYTIDKSGFANNLIFIPLEAGDYKINTIKGITWTDTSQGPSFGRGFFQLPIFIECKVEKGKISYIGRIEAIMRPRKANDFAAGPATPLIGQETSGIAKSTFDVSIVDAYDSDKILFSSIYSELKTQDVQKQIISKWQRPSKYQYDPPNTHFGFFNE